MYYNLCSDFEMIFWFLYISYVQSLYLILFVCPSDNVLVCDIKPNWMHIYLSEQLFIPMFCFQGSTCLQSTMNYEFMMTTRVVIATLLCISIISLFVSLVLHMVVPELHASTFGWMKISHLFSMFWAFLILFIMYLGGIDLVFKYSVLCKILGKLPLMVHLIF